MRALGRALRAPLRERSFALLWAGTSISLIGDGVYTIAVIWAVFGLSGGPVALAMVALALLIPQLGTLVVAGAICDRTDPRRVLIGADLLRATTMALLGLLGVAGLLRLWELIVLVAISGIGEGLASPVLTALMPRLVADDQRVAANALGQTMRPLLGRMAGPALGALLVTAGGSGVAFLVDALSFLLCAAAVARIAGCERPTVATPSLADNVRDGWRFVRDQRWLWLTLSMTAVILLCISGPLEVLVPYLVHHTLHGGAGALSLVLVGGGVGALAGGAAVVRRPLGLPGMARCWGLGGLGLVGYSMAPNIAFAVLAGTIGGAGIAAGAIVWTTIVQRRVPAELLGRVGAVDWLASFALAPLSLLLVGPLTAAIGVRDSLLATGLAGAGFAVLLAAAYKAPLSERLDVLGTLGTRRLPAAPAPVDDHS